MAQWLKSLVFTTYLFVSVAVYGLVALVVAAFGYRALYRAVLIWVDCTLWMLERICGLGYTVEGLESLPSENTVILMKHSSAWETIAQLKLFPRQTWVMKRELLWAPILGWVLMFLKPIAIDRAAGRAAVEQVIARGVARLGEGLWVVIFPEGTRVPAGQTKRYGLSGTLLAQTAGRPVVPVAHNAGEFWPRRGLLKRRGTIRVVVGTPIETTERDPRSVTADVQRWVETQLESMERR
jgi:1-acyl-sn-glycerol-3-phosphate acyltransferase